MDVTLNDALNALRDLDAVEAGHAEYARGASEALAYVLQMRDTGDSAVALLTLAANQTGV